MGNDIAKIIIGVVLVVLLVVAAEFTIGLRNMDNIRDNAPAFLTEHGFNVVAYQGYEHSVFYGATLWYTLEKNDIVYECCVIEWFDEFHLYSLKAINAVSTE